MLVVPRFHSEPQIAAQGLERRAAGFSRPLLEPSTGDDWYPTNYWLRTFIYLLVVKHGGYPSIYPPISWKSLEENIYGWGSSPTLMGKPLGIPPKQKQLLGRYRN